MHRLAETTESVADTIDFFNRMAPTWDNYSAIDGDKATSVLKVVGIPYNARILDVACGTGALLPYLLAYEPVKLVAIDISPAMVNIAHSKFDDPCLEILTCDFHQYVGYGFDLITLYNAYPHFPDRARFVKHAHTLLNPGGRLLIFHGNGRTHINGCHAKSDDVKHVSTRLRSCGAESCFLSDLFTVDVMLDVDNLYILSGRAQRL